MNAARLDMQKQTHSPMPEPAPETSTRRPVSSGCIDAHGSRAIG